MRQPHHECSSFPSGDVAGMTAFVTTCVLIVSPEMQTMARTVALMLVLTAMFGRLYFQAHFAGDVIAGASVALVSTLTFSHFAGPIESFGWGLSGKIEIAVILLWACVQKLKPKAAESENNMDNLVACAKGAVARLASSIGLR